ncbi:MAG: hypothetical protein ACLRWQ_07990 [Flavonifractor plautii]
MSSSSEDQLNSFATQNAHYTELIAANPEWEFVGRVHAGQGYHRHLGGKSGTTSNGCWRTAGGVGWTRSWEILLPVCPERQGVPGSHPGVEGLGVGGVLRGSRHRRLLSWPESFSAPSLSP